MSMQCLQASNMAPRTPATSGLSVANAATPYSSSSSDLSSAGKTSTGKKAPKPRKGGLSMFLAGEHSDRSLVGLRLVAKGRIDDAQGNISNGKRAPKQRKGGLHTFLTGVCRERNVISKKGLDILTSTAGASILYTVLAPILTGTNLVGCFKRLLLLVESPYFLHLERYGTVDSSSKLTARSRRQLLGFGPFPRPNQSIT